MAESGPYGHKEEMFLLFVVPPLIGFGGLESAVWGRGLLTMACKLILIGMLGLSIYRLFSTGRGMRWRVAYGVAALCIGASLAIPILLVIGLAGMH